MPGTSIQSYFSSPTKRGDGFTTEEVQAAMQPAHVPASPQWTPTLDYEEADLGDLSPGPRNLTLTGRIVNFSNIAKPSKQHQAAQGYLRLQLADNTGVLTVRLWYANTIYHIRLGQLVTLWTVHVSNSSEHNNLAPSTAPLFTSIFPEGERNCYFMLHEKSDDGTQFKRPFGCSDSKALAGLMTLKTFADGGYDINEPKVLVCVKSIGPRKRYINRNATTSELISLSIFDSTASASLTLYAPLCASASSFIPSRTILLISNPGWRIEKTAKLSLNGNSRLDIDPDIPDARRLRTLARRLTTREHVNPAFPVVDVTAFQTARVRALYSLAEVDECVRANPKERIVGYLSVIITALDIVTPYKRNMLMCNECCGLPVFANALSATCMGCEKVIALRINPKILAPLFDETGTLTSSSLILSPHAWTQLLGRSASQLLSTNLDVLKYLEQRLMLLRVTMGFVVCAENESELGLVRLCVWCVGN